MIKLRPYQIESIAGLRASFAQKNKNLILCLPTGAGKTVVFSEMVRLASLRKTQTLVLTDRVELFGQTFAALNRTGLTPQILNAQTKTDQFDSHALVTVAMVETFKRRLLMGYEPKLIIIDECHKGNFTKVLEQYPDARIIGATATPVGKHLYKHYDEIIQTIDIPELVDFEFLAPCKAYQMQDDFSDLETKRGEYTEQSLFNHFNDRKLYSGVVEQWLKHAQNKKTIVFNVNIEHANQMTIEFQNAGITSECITSKTPKAERVEILAAFTRGEFSVLNNCGILTTGYDEPSIEVVVMNRKTKSLPLWLQCCGRGSRMSPGTGKTKFTVLDFGMNHDEHGLWSEPRTWKLEPPKKKKLGESPVKNCPKCEAMLRASAKECEYCGYVFPEKEPEPESAGVMVEVNQNRIPSEILGKFVSDLTIDELITLQNAKRFKPSFIWRVVRSHGGSGLKEYASKMQYKRGWLFHHTTKLNDCEYKNIQL
jgi:superfamily II DNA or RNA helicase